MTNPSSSGDPRSEPPEAQAQNRRSEGWLDEAPSNSQLAISRRMRIGIIAMLGVAVSVFLWWQLFEPFQHINAHLLLVSGERTITEEPPFDESDNLVSESERVFPPADFVAEDLQAFQSLKGVLSLNTKVSSSRREGDLRELLDLRRLPTTLDEMVADQSDVLMLYVSTHTKVEDGDPTFVLNVRPGFIDEAQCRLEEILRKFSGSSAAVKLLIVDAGRFNRDPAQGAILNEFPRLLEQAVNQTGDAKLWVLSSNRSFERSHISRALERSVFNWFVVLGLSGAADFNQDWVIDLDELSRFVATEVSEVVRQTTGGSESQTPELMWGGGQIKPQQTLPTLLPIAKQRINSFKVEDPQKWLQSSRQTSIGGSFSAIPNSPVTFTSNLNLPNAAMATPSLRPNALPAAMPTSLNVRGLGTIGLNPPTNGAKAASAKPTTQNGTPPNGKAETGAAATEATASATSNDSQSKVQSTPSNARTSDTRTAEQKTQFDPQETIELATILTEAWGLRDELERNRWNGANPAVAAPEEWRLVLDKLILQGRIFRAARISDQRQVLVIVKTLRDGLQALTRGESLPYQPDYDERTSQLIRRVQVRMHSHPCRAIRPLSLGMAELLARHTGQPVDAILSTTMINLDQLIQDGTEDQFIEWMTKLEPSVEDLAEIQLARQLAADASLHWSTKQVALRVCRVAEQTAAFMWGSAIWTGPEFVEAERLRKIGERTLLDQIGRDRESEGLKCLLQALSKYARATKDLEEIANAEWLCDQLVARLPEYVRWHNDSSRNAVGAPQAADLRRLVNDLTQLVSRLDAAALEQLNEIQNIATRLGSLRDKIETAIGTTFVGTRSKGTSLPGDHLQIEALLNTTLPNGATRLQLLKTLMEIDQRNVAQLELPHLFPSILDQQANFITDWEWPVRRLDLELTIPAVGAVHIPALQSDVAVLSQIWKEMHDRLIKLGEDDASSELDDQLWRNYRSLSNGLRRFYQSWIGQIASSARLTNFPVDLQGRAKQRQALRTARRGLQLIPAHSIVLDEFISPSTSLDLTDAYRLLSWQAARYEYFRTGAPKHEAAKLTERITACRSQAAQLPHQPPLAPTASPRLAWNGITELSLEDVAEQTIELRLNWTGMAKTPSWISLHYDPEFVEIKTGSEFPVQMDVTTAYVEPVMTPDKRPSFDLSPDIPTTLRISVRRRDKAMNQSRLIVYAMTKEEITRHDIAISLPSRPTLELGIEGVAGTWTSHEQRLRLHPFANHLTDYVFSLTNRETTAREVSLKVLAPRRAFQTKNPRSELSASDTTNLIDSFGPAETLVQLPEMKLPADDKPVKIPFPKPQEEPPSPPDKPAPTIAPHGLVLVVTDSKTQRSLIEIIDIAPQRPRRFLRPRVRYNADRERIEASVIPIDRSLIPPEGVKVRAEILSPLPDDADRELDGEIVAPQFEAKLFVEIPNSQDRVVTMQVSVDGYPRAFIFHVPCQGNTGDLPEILDTMAVSITNPKPQTAFQSPQDDLPVELRVDAPDGAFQIPADLLEVGIDRNNDRDFLDEPVTVLKSDRQIEVSRIGFGPDGHLGLQVRVGDFKVRVPATGVRNSNTQLLARLTVSDRTVWSPPVPVIIDGTSPRIQRVRLTPAGPIVVGGPLKLTISAGDNDLSGIAKIEIAFDTGHTGQIVATSKLIAAELNREGNWEAALPTAELKPGLHAILVRAIDQVGNISEVTKVKLTTISAEQAAKMSQAPVSVTGIVLFQDQPVSEVGLSAESAEGPKIESTATNEQGQFELRGLVPGKWKIKAKGVVRNKTRVVESELEIKSSQPPQPLKIILK